VANAGAQKPTLRPHDGQQTLPWQQTDMREAYAEITERGVGLLQHIVRLLHAYFA
jgi:hypothetical protein